MNNYKKICVVGMGYVGLPLSVALSKYYDVFGFDYNSERISELLSGKDKNQIIKREDLLSESLSFTTDETCISSSDIIIVTVPTPVNIDNSPDVSFLKDASKMIGTQLSNNIKKSYKPIILYESTTFPGCTEDICIPIIEEFSTKKCGEGFDIGYSPERTNFGDNNHNLESIVKVVSAQKESVAREITEIYSKIIKAGIYIAPSIKVAEAAKVIENIQRDLNISLMNELAIIFDRLNINTSEVIKTASTKWNFIPYKPGLVGGHCIPVDPYYLTHIAEKNGYVSEVILSGRKINDQMHKFVVKKIEEFIGYHFKGKKSSNQIDILILGLSFKKNVSDTRNSKVIELIKQLINNQYNVEVDDPLVEEKEIISLKFNSKNSMKNDYDILILAVDHDEFITKGYTEIESLIKDGGIFLDLNSVFYDYDHKKESILYWSP